MTKPPLRSQCKRRCSPTVAEASQKDSNSELPREFSYETTPKETSHPKGDQAWNGDMRSLAQPLERREMEEGFVVEGTGQGESLTRHKTSSFQVRGHIRDHRPFTSDKPGG